MASKKKAKASIATDRISSLTDLLAADASIKSRPSSRPSNLSSSDAYDRGAWSDLAGTGKKPVKKLTGMERMHKGANKGVLKRVEKDAMMMLDARSGRGNEQRAQEERARKALEAKAKKYAARDFTEEELLNSNVDFASKEWDDWDKQEHAGLGPGHSDSSSDSEAGPSTRKAPAPSRSKALNDRFHNPDHHLPTSFGGRADHQLPTSFGGRAAASEEQPQYGEAVQEEEEWATYEDEFQREREGRVDWLDREGYVESKEDGVWRKVVGVGLRHDPQREGGFSYTKSGKDLQEGSTARYGEQSSFPVYEPSADFLARLRDSQSTTTTTPTNATNAAGQTHFDPEIEKRTRNAAAYSFAREEGERGRQMERLKRAHEETERRRQERDEAAAAGVAYLPDDNNANGNDEQPKVKVVQLTEAERAKMERKRMIEAKKEEMARKRAKKAHGIEAAPAPVVDGEGGATA